jgi:opacity protein-like surface antigen
MRGRWLLVAGCLALAAPAFGEDHRQTEVFGFAGFEKWWDDEGASPRGVNFGGGIGRRLLPQFAVEGEVNAVRGALPYPGGESPFSFHAELITANGLLYVVHRERAQVFILLGAGTSHAGRTADFPGYHASSSGWGFAANAGAGVKLFLTPHVTLRPEFRLAGTTAASATLEPFSAGLRFSIGLGYHW